MLAIVVLLVFGRSLHFPFSSWDDQRFIAQNTLLAEASLTHAIDCLRTNSVAGERLYIPVTYLSFLAERALFDLQPGASHAINVLLHVLNVLLLFCGLRMLKLARGAFIGALLFAIHPLQVEAVTWAMGRKDLLSTAFALIALLLYHRHCRQPDRRLRMLVFANFAAAILAKPAMITFPALLLLLDWHAHGRLRPRDFLRKLPEATVCLLVLYVHLTLPASAESAGPPLLDRIVAVPGVLSGWTLRFFLLEPVNPFYTWRDSGALRPLLTGSILIFLLLTLITASLRSSQRWFAGGLSFLIIAGAPALAVVVQYRIFITGDRYGYFPLIGIYFLVAKFAHSGAAPQKVALAFAVISGAFAVPAVQVWRSDINLWQAALIRDDSNVNAHNNLAIAYVSDGQSDGGLSQFHAGLKLAPDNIGLLSNLGRLLLDRGEPQAAVPVLQAVLRRQPNSFRTLKSLAEAFENLGRLDLAEGALRQAIVACPAYVDAHITLGRVLLKAEKPQDALAQLKHAATLAPKHPAVWGLLVSVYDSLGDPAAAEEARQRAHSLR
ncbi:MAG: tetratricopeptide (TPR) repeat protein [Rhodothermales bacterium]|jgi:tetratricopeptide (TPR) repeat protein